jgi:hypothetical protein
LSDLYGERERLIAFVGATPEAETSFRNPAVYAAAKGKGKSGGVRVIYYFHSEALPVFLLTVYAKNQKADLTKGRTERSQDARAIAR